MCNFCLCKKEPYQSSRTQNLRTYVEYTRSTQLLNEWTASHTGSKISKIRQKISSLNVVSRTFSSNTKQIYISSVSNDEMRFMCKCVKLAGKSITHQFPKSLKCILGGFLLFGPTVRRTYAHHVLVSWGYDAVSGSPKVATVVGAL